MTKHIFSTILLAGAALVGLNSCSDFLEEQVPQGTLTDEQVKDPAYIDNMVTSAYAIFTTAEDINSSFSLWNFDVRSDDAYKGGSNTSDGDVFHQLEVEQGIDTRAWNINGIWERFYNAISRVNAAIVSVEKCDDSYTQKQARLGELRFLRAYAHFQLKRLFKQIPFVTRTDYTYEEYGKISNTEFTNDEGWAKIAEDLEFAYNALPATQADKGRPTKAACAAFLAKVYLYKAYRQDTELSNKVTSINEADLQKVLDYTEPSIYAGYSLEKDIHNNFRPEEQYENGPESLWAIQYSRNDGSTYGNLNWSYGLIVPNISEVTDGGCDFYKPSQNLVNAYRTDGNGLPLLNDFNKKDLDYKADNTDPRLYLTVGVTGLPYMFNEKFIMDRSASWSRSGGLYGYNVTLKQNVDPELIGSYLIHGSYWASSMNRIVFRYADVILMRAEAYAQQGKTAEAIKEVNKIRERAAASTQSIANYPNKYGVKFYCKPYTGSYSKDEAMKIVKMERRLEFAMESERFFDLVRWGDAEPVLNNYFASEKEKCTIYNEASFTADKNEYLPIPFEQMSAANGNYKQNSNKW
ncbi:MAG: RagB/SusD family nutrient uptake outer membrane protein [Bacteroidaceae bacterium]|nr:RagB/SusD family nutrient uptake outer membrane protein [Bacteroidaceae bacterium]